MNKTSMILLALLSLSTLTATAQSDRRWVRHPDNGFDIWVSGTDHEHRAATRLFFWSPGRSRGEVFIGYGPADWDPKFEAGIENLRYGYTWRMASGFWTTLDTTMTLQLGGVQLEPGTHYLGLKRSFDGQDWFLAVMDPEVVRKARIDAFETSIRPVPTRFEIPLNFHRVEESAPQLKIRLDAQDDNPQGASLAIAFGPYRLSLPIALAEMPVLGEWPSLPNPLSSGDKILGRWTARIDSERGPFEITVTLATGSDGLVGYADLPHRTLYGLRLADLQKEGSDLSFRVPISRQVLSFAGTFDGVQLQGAFSLDGQQASTGLQKRSASPPRE